MTDMFDELKITVMEEDTMSSDLVGDISFRIEQVCKEPTEQWKDLQFEGKKAGAIRFRTRFEAASVPESVPDSAPEDEKAVESSRGDKTKPGDDAEESKDAPKAETKEAEKTEAATADASAKPSTSDPVETANGGELKIHVIEAKLTRDTEYFGQMDPYVEIKTSVEKKRTVTHNDGGRTPVWN